MLGNLLCINSHSIAIIVVGNENDTTYELAYKILDKIHSKSNQCYNIRFIKIQNIYGMILICNHFASKHNFDAIIVVASTQSMSNTFSHTICFNCFSQISLKFMIPIFFITDEKNSVEINCESKACYHIEAIINYIHETLHAVMCKTQ